MTPGEAIEINKTVIRIFSIWLNVDERDAIMLGVEALGRLERLRDIYGGSANELLPGETKE